MKTTYSQIALCQDLFSRLSNTELTLSYANKVKDAILELDIHYRKLDDVKTSLFEKYGEKMEDGSFVVNDETQPTFEKAWQKALGINIELVNLPIMLDDSVDIKITPMELIRVGAFIQFYEREL